MRPPTGDRLPEPRGLIGLSWRDNMLSVSRSDLTAAVDINYLEAFCRPGARGRDWGETVIPHQTTLLSGGESTSRLTLQSRLADGVVVSHIITATDDEVDFRLTACNPTVNESEAHWAQPCIRIGPFAGFQNAADPYDYIRSCFLFLSGDMTHMPTEQWATSARYTPGQVWCPSHVQRDDVNPRPLSSQVPSNGLIGCFSADGQTILATAWEPYHELFQGVIQCIHSDFRIGGLMPGERVEIKGKLYLVTADVGALVERYEADFPEQYQTIKGAWR